MIDEEVRVWCALFWIYLTVDKWDCRPITVCLSKKYIVGIDIFVVRTIFFLVPKWAVLMWEEPCGNPENIKQKAILNPWDNCRD